MKGEADVSGRLALAAELLAVFLGGCRFAVEHRYRVDGGVHDAPAASSAANRVEERRHSQELDVGPLPERSQEPHFVTRSVGD